MSTEIKGKITQLFPQKTSKKGGKYCTFMLKRDDGSDIKCNLFSDDYPEDLIWKDVVFTAQFSAQYNTWNVSKAGLRGDQPVVEEAAPPQQQQVAPTTTNEPVVAVPKKRGRPAKAVVAPDPVPVAVPAEDGREAFRAEAESSVKLNLESALRIAGELKVVDVDLVMLADLIGRTTTAILLSNKKRY